MVDRPPRPFSCLLVSYQADGDALMPEKEANADWCSDDGSVAICGTTMVEHSRRSEGERWCFTCRKRHEFWWVVMVPDGISYYGPTAHMEGVTKRCSDLFPGWYREAPDE